MVSISHVTEAARTSWYFILVQKESTAESDKRSHQQYPNALDS